MGELSQTLKSAFTQEVFLFFLLTQKEGGVEGQDGVAVLVGQLHHFLDVLLVALEGVQEVELVVLPQLVACHFVGRVHPLLQGLVSQQPPVLDGVDLVADFKGELEVGGLHGQRELFFGFLGEVDRGRRESLVDEVGDQVFLLLAQLVLDHVLDPLPLLVLHRQLELDVEVLGALHLEDLLGLVEGQEFGGVQLFNQVHGLVEGLEDAGLPVHEAVLPVVLGGVEQEVLPLPEARPDRELLPDAADDLELVVGHQNDVLPAEGDMVPRKDDLPDVRPLLDLGLAEHLPPVEVVPEDGGGGGDEELELVPAAEEPEDLHFVGEPEDLLLVVAGDLLEVDLGGRGEDGDLLLGDEAAVEGVVLPRHVGEVEVGLPLLDHEALVLLLVGLHHELRWVELVHADPADEGARALVLRLVLVQFFLLHVLVGVEEEGLHPLREDQQVLPDEAVGADRALVDLPDLEATVMTGAEQVVVLGQPQHPVPVLLLLLHLQLALRLVVPDPQRLVLGVTDQGASFSVKNYC